jgi:hypothetical protein
MESGFCFCFDYPTKLPEWLRIGHNGPAIWGGCVPPAGGWRTFCRHGTDFIKHYACRGTSFIGASKLSRYRIFVGGTGPPAGGSRYNLSRSQKSVTVQDLNCGQMRVSGCNKHYEFVLSAGALPDCRRQAGKAKSVTNNLPILSVLALVFCLLAYN